jgi:hypothetical protein
VLGRLVDCGRKNPTSREKQKTSGARPPCSPHLLLPLASSFSLLSPLVSSLRRSRLDARTLLSKDRVRTKFAIARTRGRRRMTAKDRLLPPPMEAPPGRKRLRHRHHRHRRAAPRRKVTPLLRLLSPRPSASPNASRVDSERSAHKKVKTTSATSLATRSPQSSARASTPQPIAAKTNGLPALRNPKAAVTVRSERLRFYCFDKNALTLS